MQDEHVQEIQEKVTELKNLLSHAGKIIEDKHARNFFCILQGIH